MLRAAIAGILASTGCAGPADLEADEPTDVGKADGPGSEMRYGGGPILWNPLDVYVIWYGSWVTGPGHSRPVLEDFMRSLDDPQAGYWNVLATYHDAAGHRVAPRVDVAGEVDDDYSYGSALHDYHQVVRDHLASGDLPENHHAVYLVLTDLDVATPHMCERCGSHGVLQAADGSSLYVAWVGHPGRCPTICGVGDGIGITGNNGADWMPSLIAHELAEAITDPDTRHGWRDGNGAEMADKCAWSFGATYTTSRGADANVHLGDRDYLLQQLWLNTRSGECTIAY